MPSFSTEPPDNHQGTTHPCVVCLGSVGWVRHAAQNDEGVGAAHLELLEGLVILLLHLVDPRLVLVLLRRLFPAEDEGLGDGGHAKRRIEGEEGVG